MLILERISETEYRYSSSRDKRFGVIDITDPNHMITRILCEEDEEFLQEIGVTAYDKDAKREIRYMIKTTGLKDKVVKCWG
ncbi:MAG: hypothetical protein SOW48_03585 [Peptoniphilaceae bacterium]|nr:hypothetical protein [Peptoniphilaceae bacterium]MDD7433948.1 hypothetical protein [Peptoniphilaceae bacterium]MDY3075710.1 hypothetical protein [Peptoniphilaceae bacterium]MDY4195910.1 hypothetical protein [Peptoniphilaceae bacterium]MDY6146452.1 hypothetical protein [Peptoniphilaceae bacterium]